MGRSADLKKTLLANIEANSDHGPTEFVVLDYNSKDDLHEFMLSDAVAPHIKSGRVRYLRTRIPQYYSFSRSRNVAFRNATGDIVLNVDADNFTGRGFAAYINRLANVCPTRAVFARAKVGIHGRLGMYKREFEALGGYDEDLVGYGYDDRSLLLRALAAGCTLMWWGGVAGRRFASRIVTDREQLGLNLEEANWRLTDQENMRLTLQKLDAGQVVANPGQSWGRIRDLELIGV